MRRVAAVAVLRCSWFARAASLLAVLAALGAGGRALGQCETYSVAPGPAAFVAGTTDTGIIGDEQVGSIALPFPVTLYGTTHGSVMVSTNGFVEFGGTAQSFQNNCLPSNRINAPNAPLVFVYWDDLLANVGGVQTSVTGAPGSRTFVIEWRNMYSYDTGTSGLSFEVVFYENQSYFDVVYNTVDSGATATVGIQYAPAGPSTQYSCNQAALSNGLSLRFSCIADTPGACCAQDGSCMAVAQIACMAPNSFRGAGTSCGPGQCPQAGACCSTTNECSMLVQTACAGTNRFQGPGTTCGPTACAGSTDCASYAFSTGPGVFVPGSTDTGIHSNGAIARIDLPFPVELYGAAHTQVSVSTEGYLEFGRIVQNANNMCLPAGNIPAPAIFAYWDNLTTAGTANGQGIFTGVGGTPGSRIFVIEWRAGLGTNAGAPTHRFEVAFYENAGYFDIIYAQVDGGASATVGVQDLPLGFPYSTQVQCNTATLSSGLSLRFSCAAITGACCDPVTGCSLVFSPSECSSPTGYLAGMSTCTPTPCPAPTNDSCAAAVDLSGGTFPYEVIFDNGAATDDAADCSTLYKGVWYTYTATAPTMLVCSATGAQLVNWATAPDCATVPSCSFQSTVSVEVTAGQTVKLLAGSTLPQDPPPGPMQLTINAFPLSTPPNDTCVNAISLNGGPNPFLATVYNVNATNDATDCSQIYRGVWYTYTATEATVINCSGQGVQQSTIRFAVAPGCSATPVCQEFAVVNVTALAPLSLRVEAGETIKILVGGSLDVIPTDAHLDIRFESRPAVANDTCGTALDLNAQTLPFVMPFDYQFASDDFAQCGRAILGGWFKYTANQRCLLTCIASTVNFSSEGAWAFTSDCMTLPECLPGLHPNATYELQAGETVYVLGYDPTLFGGHVRTLSFDVIPLASDTACTFQEGTEPFVPGVTDVLTFGGDPNVFDHTMTQADLPLPFPVALYGQVYTRIGVSNQGWAAFDLVGPYLETGGGLSGFNGVPPVPTDATVIFAYWDSLTYNAPGRSVFTNVIGSAGDRTFVVEWRAGGTDGDPPTHVFELALYENRPYFDLIYQTVPRVAGPTIGIQALAAGPATIFECYPNPFVSLSRLSNGLSLRVNCAAQTLPLGSCCGNSNYCVVTTVGRCTLGTFAPGGTCTPNSCDAALGNDLCDGAVNLNQAALPYSQHVETRLTTAEHFAGPIWLYAGTWYEYTAATPGDLHCEGMVSDGTILSLIPVPGCAGVPDAWELGAAGTVPWSYHLNAGQHVSVVVAPEDDRPSPPYFDVTWTFIPDCRADFNASGAVTVQDIFDFLAAYFTGSPSADVNNSGAVTVQDIFDFLARYFTGC